MSIDESMTAEEICRAGLGALRRELGLVGMIRFLQLLETGQGDYTAERDMWLDQVDLDTIAEEIQRRRNQVQGQERGPDGSPSGQE